MDEISKSVGYDEASAILGICKPTLYALVHHRRIPHVRLSPRMVLFDLEDLQEWRRAHHVPVAGAEVDFDPCGGGCGGAFGHGVAVDEVQR